MLLCVHTYIASIFDIFLQNTYFVIFTDSGTTSNALKCISHSEPAQRDISLFCSHHLNFYVSFRDKICILYS